MLRGWIRCSDGRLYHPVVAEKALEAWVEKLTQRKSSAAGNAKRYGLAFDAAPFDAAVNDSLRRLAALNPNSRTLSKRVPKGAAKPDGGTPADPPPRDRGNPIGMPDASHREAGKVLPGSLDAPDGIQPGSRRDAGTLPQGSQEKGREGKGYIPPEPPSVSLPPAGPTAKRGIRLPSDWAPDLVDRSYAVEQGLSDPETTAQAEGFRDYWLAEGGPKAWKRDWRAAWRTWCRRAVERRPTGPGLLMPIHGGARASPPNGSAHRPISGSASALAGIAAVVNAHREAS